MTMIAMPVAATTIRIASARLIKPPSRQQSRVDTPESCFSCCRSGGQHRQLAVVAVAVRGDDAGQTPTWPRVRTTGTWRSAGESWLLQDQHGGQDQQQGTDGDEHI